MATPRSTAAYISAVRPLCSPRLSNPHERDFRAVEIALLELLSGLEIVDRARRIKLMQDLTGLLSQLRALVHTAAPGRLGA